MPCGLEVPSEWMSRISVALQKLLVPWDKNKPKTPTLCFIKKSSWKIQNIRCWKHSPKKINELSIQVSFLLICTLRVFVHSLEFCCTNNVRVTLMTCFFKKIEPNTNWKQRNWLTIKAFCFFTRKKLCGLLLTGKNKKGLESWMVSM